MGNEIILTCLFCLFVLEYLCSDSTSAPHKIKYLSSQLVVKQNDSKHQPTYFSRAASVKPAVSGVDEQSPSVTTVPQSQMAQYQRVLPILPCAVPGWISSAHFEKHFSFLVKKGD